MKYFVFFSIPDNILRGSFYVFSISNIHTKKKYIHHRAKSAYTEKRIFASPVAFQFSQSCGFVSLLLFAECAISIYPAKKVRSEAFSWIWTEQTVETEIVWRENNDPGTNCTAGSYSALICNRWLDKDLPYWNIVGKQCGVFCECIFCSVVHGTLRLFLLQVTTSSLLFFFPPPITTGQAALAD